MQCLIGFESLLTTLCGVPSASEGREAAALAWCAWVVAAASVTASRRVRLTVAARHVVIREGVVTVLLMLLH